MDQRQLVGVPHATARLGVHRTTFLRWIKNGHVQAAKLGHRWRVSVAELDRLAAEGFTPKDAP